MTLKWMRILAVLTVFAVLFSPGIVLPCGPAFPSAVFYRTTQPDEPRENYYRGELGVLQSGYSSYYLVPAYRYLTGIGLNDAEQRTFHLAIILSSESPSEQNEGWRTKWEILLDDVKTPGTRVGRERHARGSGIYRIETDSGYYSYLNCHDDAFKTAVKTLNERIQMFGKQSQEATEWLKAQEIVFSNCSKGHVIPDSAPAGMPPAIQADRAYQIAAAHFYAGDFDQAEKLFSEIAKDKSSSWSQLAPYMAARALIRNATINGGYRISENPNLVKAEGILQSIIQNNELIKYHKSAQDLLGFVITRLRPLENMHKLAQMLLRKGSASELQQNLRDFRYMLVNADRDVLNAAAGVDDLTDWIVTFQDSRPAALEHALNRWEQTASLAWLVAALTKIPPGHPKQQKLQAEADKLFPTSSAYPTAVYHSLRLLIGTGKQDIARKRLDALLTLRSGRFSGSSYNRLLALRMKICANLDDFLQYAQRVPVVVGYYYGEDDFELGTGDGSLHAFVGRKLLDIDSVSVINGYMPLSMLTSIASSTMVTTELRMDMARAAWVRAVLVDDTQAANNLVPILSELVPEMKTLLADYMAASNKDARQFIAAYIMLKHPGMKPYLTHGIGRVTPTDKINNFRDNWWGSFITNVNPIRRGDGTKRTTAISDETLLGSDAYPAFLSKEMKEQTDREVERLIMVEPGPNFLASIALPWARNNPDDLRVPEALHLLVMSTRYGHADNSTTDYSKEAFSILHKNYPRSQWTKQTPYYF